MNIVKRAYGWKKQVADIRDKKVKIARHMPWLPASIDLSSGMPPITDQGQIGACTGHSSVAVLAFREIAEKKSLGPLSPLMAYYDGRLIENDTNQDGGAQIRDVIKGIARWGACVNQMWPLAKPVTTKPWSSCYKNGLLHKAIQYATPTQSDRATFMGLLATGNPLVFGFNVPSTFEGQGMASTGRMSAADWADTNTVGGHAVVVVGYNTVKQEYKIRNSWGVSWGDKGYFYMPFSFLESSACSDFWHIDLAL